MNSFTSKRIIFENEIGDFPDSETLITKSKVDANIFLSNQTGFPQRQPAITFCYATINFRLNNLSPFSLSYSLSRF